jgi:hypothetical protein
MATQKKSPLEQMKEQHKDKETLVDRLLGVVDLGGRTKEDMKAKLLAASNKKLLRLLAVANEIKDKYGSTEKLALAAAAAAGKAKDQAYVAKLVKIAERTPAKVLDLVHKGKAA